MSDDNSPIVVLMRTPDPQEEFVRKLNRLAWDKGIGGYPPSEEEIEEKKRNQTAYG